MNEILLAFVTFVLGILATILAQFVSQKFQLREQRRQKRAERLLDIIKWLESYRNLFQCRFPQLQELVLAHRLIDPNFGKVNLEDLTIQKHKDAFENICNAMREYKAAESKHKVIEKEAIFALRALGANTTQPNRIAILFHNLQQNSVYFIGDGFGLWYPKGFLKELAPYLAEIKKQKNELFYEFPNRLFYDINWKILETVKFEQLSHLLMPRHPIKHFPVIPQSRDKISEYLAQFSNAQDYTEEELELLGSLDKMESCRRTAENAIDNAMLVIEKYKTEWL